jgi:hypothetical protein
LLCSLGKNFHKAQHLDELALAPHPGVVP